jgi:hypothetical protein
VLYSNILVINRKRDWRKVIKGLYAVPYVARIKLAIMGVAPTGNQVTWSFIDI